MPIRIRRATMYFEGSSNDIPKPTTFGHPVDTFPVARESRFLETDTNTLYTFDGTAWAVATEAPLDSETTYKRGKSTFSGNGVTTDFTIVHNMNAIITPNWGDVHAGSTDARGSVILDSATFTTANVVAKYPVAPPTGTGNVILYWEVAFTS